MLKAHAQRIASTRSKERRTRISPISQTYTEEEQLISVESVESVKSVFAVLIPYVGAGHRLERTLARDGRAALPNGPNSAASGEQYAIAVR